MKLYNAPLPAPHPRRVRMFLAEKSLCIPLQDVNLFERAHKSERFLGKNSLGQLPVLELDDGDTISESAAICRYLEALHPEPPLFGGAPRQMADIEMWMRRLEFQLMGPLSAVWLHTHPMTVGYMQSQSMTRIPLHGEENRVRYLDRLAWLDGAIAGRDCIAGDTYSMADIVALSLIDFGIFVGIPLPPGQDRLHGWHARASRRSSAAA